METFSTLTKTLFFTMSKALFLEAVALLEIAQKLGLVSINEQTKLKDDLETRLLSAEPHPGFARGALPSGAGCHPFLTDDCGKGLLPRRDTPHPSVIRIQHKPRPENP